MVKIGYAVKLVSCGYLGFGSVPIRLRVLDVRVGDGEDTRLVWVRRVGFRVPIGALWTSWVGTQACFLADQVRAFM